MPSFIGEAIMSSGVIRHFRDLYPGLRITIATGPVTAQIFSELDGIERVIGFRKHRFKTHWLALWPKIFRRWDLMVDLRASALSYLVPARERIVYRAPSRRETRPHRVVVAGRQVGRNDDPPAPLIECSAATDARARALLAGDGPFLALATGSSWQGKNWPLDRFEALAIALLASDGRFVRGRVMLVGSRGENELALPLAEKLGPSRLVDLTGLDLITTFACLKQARLFIGNDSAMMHTAAAAGIPTLGLFGPTPESVYRPWSPLGATVRGPRSSDDIGFYRKGFDKSRNYMGDLTVDAVFAAATGLLDRTERPAKTFGVSDPASP